MTPAPSGVRPFRAHKEQEGRHASCAGRCATRICTERAENVPVVVTDFSDQFRQAERGAEYDGAVVPGGVSVPGAREWLAALRYAASLLS